MLGCLRDCHRDFRRLWTEHRVATGAALVAIILAVGPVSGAHLNPVITLLDRAFGGMKTRGAGVYIGAQFVGGAVGRCSRT